MKSDLLFKNEGIQDSNPVTHLAGYLNKRLLKNEYYIRPKTKAITKSALNPPNNENSTKNATGKYLLLIEQGKQQNGLSA
jgi:hypothetical protein